MSAQTDRRTERVSGVSNIAYDLNALLHNKLEGISALEKYKVDASGDQEVASLLDDLEKREIEDAQRIKSLLAQRLNS